MISFINLSSAIIPYSKIDTKLQETWDRTYPISYSEILKKDILGRGIMLLRSKEYLYTFKVFIPDIEIENGEIKKKEIGKEINIKLYFNAALETEKQYRIELGEITQKFNNRDVVKWIK
jgi:hypothetical protein